MTFFLRLIVSLSFALMALTASAQTDTPEIIPGQPVSITLDESHHAVTLNYASPGDETITLSARDLATGDEAVDTVIRVIAPDDTQIAYADYNAGADDTLAESDAAVPHLYLPDAGVYRLWISSYGGIGRGDVEIALNLVDAFEITGEVMAGGEIVLGRLPEGRVYRHIFDVEAGTYTLTARDTGGTLDLRIRLLDADGVLVASNDDHDTDDLTLNLFDAQITAVDIPVQGAYTLEISDFLGRAGTFELALIQGEANP